MDRNKIRIKRVIKDITQDELSRLSGVSRDYISQIETGKKVPSLAVLERIAHALGCNIKDFF